MLKTFTLILFTQFVYLLSSAQELNCNVIINADQIQTSDRRVFEDMKNVFQQFLNDKKWTEDSYKNEERIDCNLVVTIESQPSIGTFTASAQIQSARPIFNTNYQSILFNFADREWSFNYVESQPIQFTENTFSTNLSSLLAFYAYIIIGLDYDSFGKLGGTAYYQKAWDILNTIPANVAENSGWDKFGNQRNRYWLIENLLNQQMTPIREALYTYHRMVLDQFLEKPDENRQQILEVLKNIQKANQLNPNAILLIAFFDAKASELSQLFSEGNLQVRREAFTILTRVNPSNSNKYRAIVER